MATKKDYIEYLLPVYNIEFPKQLRRQRDFLSSDSLDHMAYDAGLYCTDISIMLYENGHDKKYLLDAVEYFSGIIKAYNKYRKANAIPEKPLTNRMFGIATLCETYIKLNKYNKFSEEFNNDFYDYLVDLSAWIIRYPEWGTHNRSSVRGLGLYMCYLIFKDRPMSYKWYRTGLSLIEDNLGKWAQEDASTYHPIWVEDIYKMYDLKLTKQFPQTKTIINFYLDYFAYTNSHQFVPLEFGDGRLGTQFGHVINLLERGARDFNNKEYKYVADRIFKKMKSLNLIPGYILNQSRALTNAIENMDDSIEMEEIYNGSMETIDDLITKKIIFKSGLSEEKDTSLFLNYKDEIENSYLGRKNLDYTICAPAEKNHHGHPDENSINLLAYKDSVLLHDGGYREKVDLTGAFRSDYFHNKLIFRNEVKDNLHDTFMIEPNYNKVKTHKVYFKDSNDSSFSRTVVEDFKHNLNYDRMITFNKNLNIFIVVDMVKSNKRQELFISNQYFSQIIKKEKDNMYLTRYENIVSDEIKETKMPEDKNLLIYFIKDMGQSNYQIEEFRRSYTYENIISNNKIYDLKKNDIITFVTILSPYDLEPKLDLMNGIKVYEENNGVQVVINDKNTKYYYSYKKDIEKGFKKERRPMHEYNKTKIEIGDVKTDAIYSEVKENSEIHYKFVFGSKLIYKNKALFEIVGKEEFYQANLEIKKHIGSYPYFEE